MLHRTFTCICVVPIAGQITSDLDGHDASSSSGSALLVTIWELGEAAGPLFIAPLSEVYGRYPVMNVANLLFVSATLFAALCTSTRLFVGARALTGLAVAVNVLNPAIIGDMFESDQRGSAMSAVMLAPLIGGAVGPAFSGAVSEVVGWRTVLLIAAGLAFSCELVFLTFFRETYKMAILRRRAVKLRNEAGDYDPAAVPVVARQGLDLRTIWDSISRPVTILFGSKVLFSLAMLGSVSFSYFYVMSVSLPYMLEDIYGFSPAEVGASFVAFSKSRHITPIHICFLFFCLPFIFLSLSFLSLKQLLTILSYRLRHRCRSLQRHPRQDLHQASGIRRGPARVPPPARHLRRAGPALHRLGLRLDRRMATARVAPPRRRGGHRRHHPPRHGPAISIRRRRLRRLLGVCHDWHHSDSVPHGDLFAAGDRTPFGVAWVRLGLECPWRPESLSSTGPAGRDAPR